MGDPASSRFRWRPPLGLRIFIPRTGGRSLGLGNTACVGCGGEPQVGLVVWRLLDTQGRARHSRLATIATGAGSGVPAAFKRARDLSDGPLDGVGGGVRPGA